MTNDDKGVNRAVQGDSNKNGRLSLAVTTFGDEEVPILSLGR
jgi:hypothetical protein